MKCPSCAVIFPDNLRNCPRCKIGLVADGAPLDPKLRAEFKSKVKEAREQAKLKSSKKGSHRSAKPKAKAKPVKTVKAGEPGAAQRSEPDAAPAQSAPAAQSVPSQQAPQRDYEAPSYRMERTQSKPKLPMVLGAVALIALIAIAAWFIATRESRAFKGAEQADTLAAYQEFLERFPDGPHKEDARLGLAKLKLSHLHTTTDLGQFERYLDEYGDTVYAAEARQALERALIAAARNQDDLGLYRKFLSNFPTSSSADQARERAAQLEKIAAFFNDPEFVARRVDAEAIGETAALWAAENLRPGDTLHAFARNGEMIGSCTLEDVTQGLARYRRISAARDEIDFYAVQFARFATSNAQPLKLGVAFAGFSTWITGTDVERVKQLVVEGLKGAVPDETFELVYPADDEDPGLWGTVQIAYKDLRHIRAVDVPAELGGSAYRSRVSLTLTLDTSNDVKHSWAPRVAVSQYSPRRFPQELSGSNAEELLRDAAVRLAAEKIPRLAPK